MAGLDFAGKTCLLEKAFNLKDTQLLTEMPPTQGVERQPYDFIGADMIIWDLGGQVQYRDRYFDKPEMLQGATALIFVIDIQKPDRFIEAANYFARILKTVENETFRKYIFYHKFDPDNAENLKENLVQARQIFGILNPFLEKPAVSFATSIYSDTADRAARQVLWDIIPPVELETIPTVSAKSSVTGLVDITPRLEEPTPVDKVTDRLAMVIEEHLQNHDELIALGIFKRDGTYISGVAKSSSDNILLKAASNAIKTVGASFVDEMNSTKIKEPIQMDFEDIIVRFEIISPDHVAAIFCSSLPSPEVALTISNLNRFLNQALGFMPAEIEQPQTIKQTLMSELKTKLKQRRTLIEFQTRYSS